MLLFTCSKAPKPIEYGHDNCNYCSMTIMDDRHASEIITEKGKVYKYDSIECMIRSLKTHDEPILKYLVMDFNNADTFIDATTATYLISESLPSPMGANLSAFQSEEEVVHSGALFDWDSIRSHIK